MRYYYSIVIAILFSACGEPQKEARTPEQHLAQQEVMIPDSIRAQNGYTLYLKYCESCHGRLGVLDNMLNGTMHRLPSPSEEYFMALIANNDSMIAAGDVYAIELANYSPTDPDHSLKDSLSRKDIEDIMTYVRKAAGK